MANGGPSTRNKWVTKTATIVPSHTDHNDDDGDLIEIPQLGDHLGGPVADAKRGDMGDDDPDEDMSLKDVSMMKSALNDFTATAEEETCILKPNTARLARWDAVIMLLLLYVAIVTPVEVAFEQSAPWLFWVNRLVDVCFICDMVLQFFLAYDNGFNLVLNPKTIARHYLRGWFSIDLVSVFPFDALSLMMADDTGDGANVMDDLKVLRFVRLLRLIKLVRLLRGSRIIQRWETELGISYAVTSLGSLTVSILFLTHWLACMWRMTLQFESDPSTTWLYAQGMQDESWGDLYIYCVYWAVTTVSTIGYGDAANPNTPMERGMGVICMILGSTVWAYVLGSMTSLISTMGQGESEYRMKVDTVNRFMNEGKFQHKFKVSVREYFQRKRNINSWNSVLDEMSPTLRAEMATRLYKTYMEKVKWMQGRSPGFMSSIALKLRVQLHAPAELLPTKSLHIVKHGVAVRGNAVYAAGSIWGEDFVLANPKLRRTQGVRAMGYIEVYTLTHRCLNKCLEFYPEDRTKIRSHVLWLMFKRGVVFAAKQLLKLKSDIATHILEAGQKGIDVKAVFREAGEDCDGLLNKHQLIEFMRNLGCTEVTDDEENDDTVVWLLGQYQTERGVGTDPHGGKVCDLWRIEEYFTGSSSKGVAGAKLGAAQRTAERAEQILADAEKDSAVLQPNSKGGAGGLMGGLSQHGNSDMINAELDQMDNIEHDVMTLRRTMARLEEEVEKTQRQQAFDHTKLQNVLDDQNEIILQMAAQLERLSPSQPAA